MRYFDFRGFLIGCATVALFLVGYVSFPYLHTQWGERQGAAALASILDCLEEEHATQCSIPYVRVMLEQSSGADVMSILSAHLSPLQCHYIGHVVGQQSYLKYHDLELANGQCSRACDSACTHGIIGEMFAEQLGYDPKYDADDLRHLSSEDVMRIGKQLCTVSSTCHGVGHTLFQIYGNFEESLAVCRGIADNLLLVACATGLFMEYADVLTAKEIATARPHDFPAVDEIDAFCDWPSFEEALGCFRYFPRIAITTFENSGMTRIEARTRTFEICEAYPPGKERIGCFVGLGSYSSYLVLEDAATARAECEMFSGARDRMACYIGQVMVSMRNRKEVLVPYCKSLPEEEMRTMCFEAFYSLYVDIGGGPEEIQPLCEADDRACVDAFDGPILDPWEELQRRFK